MALLTDWLARTFYVSQDDIDTHNQVADAQQAIVNRQTAEGKIDFLKSAQLSDEIHDSRGDVYYDAQLGKPGAAGLPGLALSYWYVFAILFAIGFFYFGGLGLLRRRFKF